MHSELDILNSGLYLFIQGLIYHILSPILTQKSVDPVDVGDGGLQHVADDEGDEDDVGERRVYCPIIDQHMESDSFLVFPNKLHQGALFIEPL